MEKGIKLYYGVSCTNQIQLFRVLKKNKNKQLSKKNAHISFYDTILTITETNK